VTQSTTRTAVTAPMCSLRELLLGPPEEDLVDIHVPRLADRVSALLRWGRDAGELPKQEPTGSSILVRVTATVQEFEP
jgi:hypothetical protein